MALVIVSCRGSRLYSSRTKSGQCAWRCAAICKRESIVISGALVQARWKNCCPEFQGIKMFVDEIRQRVSPEGYAVLSRTGIGSFDEMYALTVQFPSIANIPGLRLPSLSHVAASGVSSAAIMSSVQAQLQTPVQFGYGAFLPPNSHVGIGYQQPMPLASGNASLGPQSAISPHRLPSSVKDQGQRGTCVAHAVVACVEWRLPLQSLSEQFKYWAAKTHGDDPFPEKEGTWLRCAKNSLASHGVCKDSYWPYNPIPSPGNPTQADSANPSQTALQDATGRRLTTVSYGDPSPQNSGKALLLAQELQNGPVAVGLPVFRDSLSRVSNWSWSGALDYGHVLDPTTFSFVTAGHAVCVCEYIPSTVAPGGGWFVFKNSWGVNTWSSGGAVAPPAGHPSWKPGYGYLSAAYVDEYLLELLRVA